MTRDEIFAEKFSELTTSEQIACYNRFAEYSNYAQIMPLDEFTVNELFSGMSPWDIIWKFRDVDLTADYFVEDTYFNTYCECSIYDDFIADYVDEIYNSDHFSEWISDDDLDDACTEYFTGVIEEEFGEQDEDVLAEFFEEYYDNMSEDDENLKEFQAFLDERKKAAEEDDDEGDE